MRNTRITMQPEINPNNIDKTSNDVLVELLIESCGCGCCGDRDIREICKVEILKRLSVCKVEITL
jgi:hypothetical protein